MSRTRSNNHSLRFWKLSPLWDRQTERLWIARYVATASYGHSTEKIEHVFVQQFWPGYMTFGLRLCMRYEVPTSELPRLILEANYRTLIRFDLARDVRFMTYAVHSLRAAIRYEANHGSRDTSELIYVPFATLDSMRGALKKGRDLSKVEQAAFNVLGTDRYHSIDYMDPDTEFVIPDTSVSSIEDDLLVRRGQQSEAIETALAELNPRQRLIIQCRYLCHRDDVLTLEEMAVRCHKDLGGELVSRERIRQIEDRALTVMRRALQRGGYRFSDLVTAL